MTDADRSLLRGLEMQWRANARQADRWASEADAQRDGANSHAFRKERRIWTTCADQLSVVLSSLQEEEEEDVTRVEPGATSPSTGTTAK